MSSLRHLADTSCWLYCTSLSRCPSNRGNSTLSPSLLVSSSPLLLFFLFPHPLALHLIVDLGGDFADPADNHAHHDGVRPRGDCPSGDKDIHRRSEIQDERRLVGDLRGGDASVLLTNGDVAGGKSPTIDLDSREAVMVAGAMTFLSVRLIPSALLRRLPRTYKREKTESTSDNRSALPGLPLSAGGPFL